MNLEQYFKQNNKLALAFSGGTDSSLLLYEGIKNGCDIKPYFIKTAFQPSFELDDAKKLCDQLGVHLAIVELDVFCEQEVIANPSNRCYFCKNALFKKLIECAKSDGYHIVIDGTNASDDTADRPGMRALAEMGVLSPLRECEITKTVVREKSGRYGLFTAKKPSYACLATRIPSNTKITKKALIAVEKSEEYLFSLGFSDLRVRIVGDMAKIQLPYEQYKNAIEKSLEITNELSKYFKEVVLDLKPR